MLTQHTKELARLIAFASIGQYDQRKRREIGVAYRVVRRPAAAQTGVQGPESTFVIEDSTGHLVALAARLFGRALQLRIAEHGVSVGQWPLLLILWDEDGLTQRELSRRVHIEEPTTARTLERMERDGLVRRVRNQQDRRQINVFVTEHAAQLRDELIPCAQEVNALATHGLSEQDKTKINSLLSYMIARLI